MIKKIAVLVLGLHPLYLVVFVPGTRELYLVQDVVGD